MASVASQGLRQASELGKQLGSLKANFIDPAVVEWASPSGFNYRKSEIFSGGISSMKSAVTSLSKKYNELRDAIIATPSRNGWRVEEESQDEVDGFWNSRRESFDFLTVEFSCKETDALLQEGQTELENTMLRRPQGGGPHGPFCLGIWMTSCSKCHNCKGLLFDEEIMAGWSPDDSNLNTKCWHCERMTLPLLTVTLYDLRYLSKEEATEACFPSKIDSHDEESTPKKNQQSQIHLLREGIVKGIQERGDRLEPLTVPYLSPLVLRKELETMLGHDGDSCLTESSFSEHHPILYWNMLWYFSRLKLPSHLPGLILPSLPLLQERTCHESWKEADWRNVFVRCLWDNTIFHQEFGSPLYIQWKENYNPSALVRALTPHRSKIPKDILQSFLTLLHYNKVNRCLEMMVQLLKKKPAELRYRHYPLYRELLFFASVAVPGDALDIAVFEQEYRREFDKLLHTETKAIRSCDGPPSLPAIFCRKYFRDLEL